VYRQRFAPGLNYFRKDHHRAWISLWALLSFGFLLSTVIGEVIGSQLPTDPAFEVFAVATYLVAIVFAVGSTIVWNILDACLPTNCQWLEERVADTVNLIKQSNLPPA
jgi:uncharacterized membrane protein YfcA